jgi:hypothetical protein
MCREANALGVPLRYERPLQPVSGNGYRAGTCLCVPCCFIIASLMHAKIKKMLQYFFEEVYLSPIGSITYK